MRKIILSILALILLIGAIYGAKLIIDSKTAPKPKVKKEVKIVSVDTIVNTTVPVVIPANGNLQAKNRVDLYAEVTGVFRPTGKLFRVGQEYRKGETIIHIDNTEFYAQVQSARSNLNNQITAIMPDLRLDYPESFQAWQYYLDNWKVNQNTPSLPEPANDKEKYFITGRNIYATYYSLKNLESCLGRFRVRAPFAGVLTEDMVSEGTLVRNGQQLGEFIKTGTYELQVAISAEFADLLQKGEPVTLYNISKTKEYQGKVTRINAKVDPGSQTITTVIEVSDKDLKEGMYLTANLEAQKVDNAVSLNRNLLQDGNQIFTVRGDSLVLTEVQPVHFSDKMMVVKNLVDGTAILSKTVPGAYEGMIVKTESEISAEAKAAEKTETAGS